LQRLERLSGAGPGVEAEALGRPGLLPRLRDLAIDSRSPGAGVLRRQFGARLRLFNP
jgi:hypothetical protein